LFFRHRNLGIIIVLWLVVMVQVGSRIRSLDGLRGNVHGGAFVHGAAFVHARDLRCNHPPEDHNTTTTAPSAIEN
jgi:hypothetical protein